ncbi:MAG: 3-deoxy-manno-octulosonate cytidylyltransferase [Abitibacteriaceae bacterium]|nr:3-deoxy-manno-octulosonate cytidylyltransferase [Abditibacteriaceae bacterium]
MIDHSSSLAAPVFTNLTDKIIPRSRISEVCAAWSAQGKRVVFTNGCFDILHAGHVQLLHEARGEGNCLVVGINSDASVKRLKGDSRPVHSEAARAFVLAALSDVDAVCVFEEDTPVELIKEVRPAVHVKGGDYRPDDLPEAATVREAGGAIKIVPLRAGFSTTSALEKLQQPANADSLPPSTQEAKETTADTRCLIIIPARFGSTRFPGKPLAHLGEQTVIEHVVQAGLKSGVNRPICVATDDAHIASAIKNNFQVPQQVEVIMTSPDCHTGTDRIAEAIQTRFKNELSNGRLVIINVQGDEPFINPQHIDALADVMRADANLTMATLATPIHDAAHLDDPNVVKVVVDQQGYALYFSRCSIPYEREDAATLADARQPHLRHLGVYAYSAEWLLRMATLPPTPLEETERLEQLRALENGVAIKVLTVHDVVNIAIDTPQDLVAAEQFLAHHKSKHE